MTRGRPRSPARLTTETVACPTCDAPAGKTCTTIGGTNERRYSHVARRRKTATEPSALTSPCPACGAPSGVRCTGHPKGPAIRYHLTTLRETT